MPKITRRVAVVVADAPVPCLSQNILTHLGQLLRDAYAPDDTDRFVALLSRLDAALAGTGRDDAAFRADLLRLMPALRRYATSLTHDPTAAEDVVQDALLRGWRARASFTPGTNIEAWLFTITRNVFYGNARKRGREVSDGGDERAARLTVIPEQGGRADLADARAALGRLPVSMREALVLVAIEDKTYEEVAAIQGCRVGTVKSRVWRARDRLVRDLGFDGSEVGGDGLMLAAASAGSRESLPPK